MSMTIGGFGASRSALNNIYQVQQKKVSAMEKLSSGLRINQGKDDPAGLLISELLRSQLSGLGRALSNTQETNNMMSIAEGGLSSVSSMLGKMKGLAVHALNSGVTSGFQTQADQMEMNSLLSSVNRVASTTNYAGSNLLNGSNEFTFQTTDPGALLDASGTSISNITGSAPSDIDVGYTGDSSLQAERAYVEADFGGSALTSAQEFTITGAEGGRSFSFDAGTSIEDMAAQINAAADSTGVNAYAIRVQGTGATSIRLASTEYGSDAAVTVAQTTGSGFAAEGQTIRDAGQDAMVTVNGQSVTTDGLTANVQNGSVNATIEFNAGDPAATTIAQTGYDQDDLTNAVNPQQASLTNIQGGMQVQLGEGGGSQNRDTVSIGDYSTGSLGQVEYNGETYSMNDLFGGGEASLANNPELAIQIIDQAISDVASGRADIGAYQANTLDTNAANLMTSIENTMATESYIRDADMAEMMTSFVQNQLLENSGLRGLQTANINAQNVLQLLGGIGAR